MVVVVAVLICLLAAAQAAIYNYELLGAVPLVNSDSVVTKNRDILNVTLNTMKYGDRLIIPNKTFHLQGGIEVFGLAGVTIQIDGTLKFTDDRETWPTNEKGDVLECIYMQDIKDIVFTSTGKGTLDGNGKNWWGAIKFLKYQVAYCSTILTFLLLIFLLFFFILIFLNFCFF